jgi:cobalt-zinc-cadmium efflux system membrane fusion protein
MTAAENKLHLLGMDQEGVETLTKTSEIQPHYTVRAPIAGQVISREVTLGELVNPDKEALLVLADMSTLWIIADVPEARMAVVAVGSKASIKIAALMSGAIEGTVSYIDPSLDANTRSGRVRIEIKNSNTAIRPGMFCQAEIVTATANEATPVLAVPDEAVQTVEGTPAVFVPVPGEQNTFAMRPVDLGKPVGNMIPVMSGLKEGEQVVVSGSFVLKAELGKGAAEEH